MLHRITAPPHRRPKLSDVLAPAAVAIGVGALGLASEEGASPVLWVIAAVLLASAARQAYWAHAYRHVSDEAIALRGARPNEASGYLGVPTWKETAGRWLPHRLEAGRDWGGLVFLGAFTVFWCFMVGISTVAAWGEGASEAGRWLLVPFQLIGLGLLGVSVHRTLSVLRFRPTVVELSKHPLRPGERAEVIVVQHGPMRIESLTGKLLAEEKATYRVGTDTRTETHRVFEEVLFVAGPQLVPRGEPFRFEGVVHLPPTAMHSFDLGSNALTWRLEVEGDVPRFPDFSHEVTLTVVPPERATKGPYR